MPSAGLTEFGGWPRSPRWVWAVAGLAAAAVLAAAVAVTVITTIGHSPPAARRTACAAGQVPGYSNHRSYPPGIPTGPPPGTHLVRCFATPMLAAAQHFAVATPAGTLIVRGVFLVPTGPLTLRQCQAVARALGYAVPCPAVAPALWRSPLLLPSCDDNPGGGCSMEEKAGFDFTEHGFAVPPRYHDGMGGSMGYGMGGSTGYFVLVASRNARVTDECPSRPPIRRLRIGGDPAAFYRCPLHASSAVSSVLVLSPMVTAPIVVLTWAHHGINVEVSFLGGNTTNMHLDLAVARHLSWITPAR